MIDDKNNTNSVFGYHKKSLDPTSVVPKPQPSQPSQPGQGGGQQPTQPKTADGKSGDK